jgi:integrase
LQLIGAIDHTTALEILDVEAVTVSGRSRQRPALDEATWRALKDRAAARVLELAPAGRATAPVATRDLAIVVCLGELGLRSEELRRLRLTDLTGIRAGQRDTLASRQQARRTHRIAERMAPGRARASPKQRARMARFVQPEAAAAGQHDLRHAAP